MSKESPFFKNAPMILSFHPCFVADAQIILADRQLNAEDRRLIRRADAVILPQACSLALYKNCAASEAHVFPDYGVRFRYPGKVGQSLLFEKLKIPHPATRRWRTAKRFRDSLNDKSAPPHEVPFLLKADESHEGDGVLFVNDKPSLDTALLHLEKIGSTGFISQELIPCGGNVLRAVVFHKEIITYWKRADPCHGVIVTVSHGSRIDKKWNPELQAKGRAQARCICEKTGINLAAFDFVFSLESPEMQPLLLEINYYFGRRGLGGSLRYYRLLLKAIQGWLEEKGFDARSVKLA
jgi:ribosomal protein S6--L-glutamate ligase